MKRNLLTVAQLSAGVELGGHPRSPIDVLWLGIPDTVLRAGGLTVKWDNFEPNESITWRAQHPGVVVTDVQNFAARSTDHGEIPVERKAGNNTPSSTGGSVFATITVDVPAHLCRVWLPSPDRWLCLPFTERLAALSSWGTIGGPRGMLIPPAAVVVGYRV